MGVGPVTVLTMMLNFLGIKMAKNYLLLCGIPGSVFEGQDAELKFMKNTHITKANKYIKDILSGKIDACLYVKQACQRQVDDLKKSEKKNYPYHFNNEAAENICEFAEMMPHIKGKWAGELMALEPWECFILTTTFGWLDGDGLRRFRELYAELPRKNGKSVIGAIIGNYMFAADGEPGAEVYSGATTLLQALEVFRPAWLMAQKTEGFRNRFNIELGGTEKNPGNIYSTKTASRFEAVIGKPGDGASVHCGMVDEYHEHPDDTLYDCFVTGMGARAQPLLAVLTTAGTNTSYPCYSKRKQVLDMLAGKKDSDALFGVVYTIDKDDDWTDFKVWKKANPNLGVSVYEHFLRLQHKTALQQTRKQNILKCKHLNLWSNAGDAWLNMVEWETAANTKSDRADFLGEPVYMGLDLASKIDIAALMMIFVKEGHYYLFSQYYIPESRTQGEDMSHYAEWVKDGYMIATPGSRIDFDYIKRDILQYAKEYDLSGEENGGGEICNDPWNAQQLITELMKENIAVVEVSQTVNMLSEPMKETEAALKDGKFHHDGNPVTTWMMGNVMCRVDKKDNIFPYKEGDANKIDGSVACITGMARAMYDKGSEEMPIPIFV